jgi:hypothetical protein
MSNKIEDLAQKRIVELGITEHALAGMFERGYWDGYIQGEIDATQRAVDIILDSAKDQLLTGRKKLGVQDVETRPVGKAETR